VKALQKALRRPSVACVLISLLVLAAVLGVRAKGWLQRPELIAYDFFVRQQSEPNVADDRIVLIGMTEDDLKDYGYPLDDEKLAQVLTALDKLNPCVIGLDLYRDLPEPRDRKLYPRLEAALKELKRVIAIERVGYFKAPEALWDDPDRIVANNLPKDFTVDGHYRRGPLVLETDLPSPMSSLSLGLTLKYLEQKGIPVELVEVPGQPDAPLFRLGKTVFPRLTPDAGGYVGLPRVPKVLPARARDYEFLADFRAPQRFCKQNKDGQSGRDTPYDYSFREVLDGKIDPDALRGRIAIVATVMQSIKDSNPTPIEDNLRGVQIHVMLIHQLLQAAIDGVKPLSWWPEWAEIVWIAGFTLLGGALSLLLRSPWKLAPALALVLGGLGYGAWLSFKDGTWLLLAAPGIGCFVAATFVTSFTAYLERSERGAMQTLFSKHVSPSVAQALWAEREKFLEGGRLRPQRLTATVLFTDLKGFSTTSEKMDPSTLMDWMNEYMNGIAHHVDRHGGMVNKFIGDAIMAVFGAPVAHQSEEEFDQDARNAVDCALAMRRELAQLNAGWKARGLPTTAMRVGIYTGPLVAGSMGSAQRLEFTVLGDTVNTAARLESAGKDAGDDPEASECMILIGDATWQRLHGRFVTRLVGPMNLKGKQQQIIVHSVLAPALQNSPS
jgi:CHASE2 domain-containing sensor protein/class 3 adenylate cyclase